MDENPFSVDLWNDFWHYVYYWVKLERQKAYWDKYWAFADLFDNFCDIMLTEARASGDIATWSRVRPNPVRRISALDLTQFKRALGRCQLPRECNDGFVTAPTVYLARDLTLD